MPKTLENTDDAMRFAMKLIGLRRRSEAEIRQRLEEKSATPELVEEIVEELYRYRYLDDEAFAESYINDRINFRPAGRYAIKNELIRKGISPKIIEDKLSGLLGKEKELDLAGALIRKKIRTAGKSDTDKMRSKLIFHLKSRGFSSDIISQAMKNALELDKTINHEDD